MAFVFAVLAVLVAAVQAGIFEPQLAVAPATVTRITASPYATAPVAKAIVAQPVVAAPAVAKAVAVDTNFDPNPQYTFSYEIQDAVTGDNKAQTESRNGDVVQGQYTLIEPDGTRRTVDYTADPVNGFNAIVHRDASTVVKAAVAAPVVAKVAVASPVVAAGPLSVAAPALGAFHHAAPIFKTIGAPVAYSAPIAKAFATPVAYATPAIGKALIH